MLTFQTLLAVGTSIKAMERYFLLIKSKYQRLVLNQTWLAFSIMGVILAKSSRQEKGLATFAAKPLIYMVRPTRFERVTAWFVARYSIQLSYGRLLQVRYYPVISFNSQA